MIKVILAVSFRYYQDRSILFGHDLCTFTKFREADNEPML